MKRNGVVLASHFSAPQVEKWSAFVMFRADDAGTVRRHLQSFPIATHCGIEVTELLQV